MVVGGGDDRGRGRGRGDGRGRGAAPARPPPVEMTASGPFALGPAMAGSAGSRRAAPRSNFTPILPGGAARGALASGLTNSIALSLGVKRELNDLRVVKKEGGTIDDDGEVYSDPDEGVEIVDMENVRGMDWMAPESLRKEKVKKKGKKVKNEEADKKGKGVAQPDALRPESAPRENSVEEVTMEEAGDNKVNLANALNLSDSEEEEELEDIIEDFAQAMDMDLVRRAGFITAQTKFTHIIGWWGQPSRPPVFLPVPESFPTILLSLGCPAARQGER